MTDKPMPEIQPNLEHMTALELWHLLQQPGVLHVNILRGLLPLSRTNALHIAGATDYDSIKAENARLTTERDQARGGNPFWDMARNALAENDQLRAEIAQLKRQLQYPFENTFENTNASTSG